jgi:hypothetical protein
MLLVAVTVMAPVEAGPLNRPLASMVPPLADQFTEGLVPACAVALHFEVPFGPIVAGLHPTLIAPTVVVAGGLPPPPQAVKRQVMEKKMNRALKLNLKNSLVIPHRKGSGKSAFKEIKTSIRDKGAG